MPLHARIDLLRSLLTPKTFSGVNVLGDLTPACSVIIGDLAIELLGDRPACV